MLHFFPQSSIWGVGKQKNWSNYISLLVGYTELIKSRACAGCQTLTSIAKLIQKQREYPYAFRPLGTRVFGWDIGTLPSLEQSVTESKYSQVIFEILGEPESLLVLSWCKSLDDSFISSTSRYHTKCDLTFCNHLSRVGSIFLISLV